ncbi:hypothetical protein [Clostridium sp. M14]|uniref:hypothetical protein n=1 Tax=Clostridium sp. M14 TaxID=2716311 RepID=UPI0013EEA87F|nr:hypothetical protein [Clostridium sp. M14]MBZ9693219.1 hypothetical protein [Clostridium sp. M14]
MNKEIKKIEFILENCEVIEFEGKHVGDFDVENIKTNISRIACNSISKHNVCETFAIEISSLANTEIVQPWGDKIKPFDRLNKYQDITSIEIHYNDNTSDKILVDYCSESENLGANNLNQESYISDLGNLYIIISKNKTLENYWNNSNIFELDGINNKKHMDFKFKMYDIIPMEEDD